MEQGVIIILAAFLFLIWYLYYSDKISFRTLEASGIALGLIIWILWLHFSRPFFSEYKKDFQVSNLNWNWDINFVTEASSYSWYVWMNLEFRTFIIWNKRSYKGVWEKIRIRDNDLVGNQRDRIEMEISLDWDRFYWIYKLDWKERDTDWSIIWIVSKEWDKISGTFVWNAADSKWSITGEKIK